jgi:hypothetical protein
MMMALRVNEEKISGDRLKWTYAPTVHMMLYR